MADNIASLGFEVNSKPLDDAKTKLGEVATEAGKTGKAVDDLNQKVSKTGPAVTAATAPVSKLTAETAKFAKEAGVSVAVFESMAARAGMFGTSMAELSARIAANKAVSKEAATGLTAIGAAAVDAGNGAKNLYPLFSQISGAGAILGNALNKAAPAATGMGSAFKSAHPTVLDLGAALRGLAPAVTGLGENLKWSAPVVADLGAKLKWTAPAVADFGLKATAAGAAAGAAAVGVKAKTAAVSDMEMAVRRMGPVLNQFSGGLGAVLGASNALRLGIVGLAAVAGGAALVGLAKIADEVSRTQNRFAGLTGSAEAGAKALDAVKAAAKSSGNEFSAVASAVEKARIGQDKFADRNVIYANTAERAAKQTADLSAAFGTFGAMLNNNLATADEAKTALNALGESFKNTGELTVDAFRKIQDISPSTARAVSEAFGYKNVEEFVKELGKAPIKLDEFVARMALVKPQVDATFDPDKPKTFEQAMRGVTAAWDDFLKTLADSGALSVVTEGTNLLKGAIAAMPGIIANEVRDLKALASVFMYVASSAGSALEAVGNFAIGGVQKLTELANSAIAAAQKVARAIAGMFSGSNVPGNAPSLSDTGDVSGGGSGGGSYSNSSNASSGGSSDYSSGGGFDPGVVDYGGGSADYGYFATGGQFTVAGSGGTDSQKVSFKATPGEVVTVSTPGDMAKAAAGGIKGLTAIQGEGGGIVSTTPDPAQMATIKEITDAIDQSTINLSKKTLEGSDNIVSAIKALSKTASSPVLDSATGLPIGSSVASAPTGGRTIAGRSRSTGESGGGINFPKATPPRPEPEQRPMDAKDYFGNPNYDGGPRRGRGGVKGGTPGDEGVFPYRAPAGQFAGYRRNGSTGYVGGLSGLSARSDLNYGSSDFYGTNYDGSGDFYGSVSDYDSGTSDFYGTNYDGGGNFYGSTSDYGYTDVLTGSFDPGVVDYGGGSADYGYFATGGKFTVGGDGGTDSTKVSFRATQGETVEITPTGVANPIAASLSAPNSDPSKPEGASTTTKNVIINVQAGIQAESFIRSRAQITRGI